MENTTFKFLEWQWFTVRASGYFHYVHMHIGYVPRERPPFSARNFRSRAYHFHKWQTFSAPEHHYFSAARQILHFWPLRRPSFLSVQAIHRRPRPAYGSQPGQRPGISGRPECQPDASNKFEPAPEPRIFTLELAPEPRIFTLELAPEPPPPPFFTLPLLAQGTWPICGVSAQESPGCDHFS